MKNPHLALESVNRMIDILNSCCDSISHLTIDGFLIHIALTKRYLDDVATRASLAAKNSKKI